MKAGKGWAKTSAAWALGMTMVLSMAACSEDLGIDSVAWACSSDQDCQKGVSCVSGLCGGGSTPDVQPGDADPGHVDGQVADASPADAGADPGPSDVITPTPTRYKAVAAGTSHTCAITEAGTIRCWGKPTPGILESPAGNNWERIGAGKEHSCAIDTQGTMACWGRNTWAQTQVPPNTTWEHVACGDEFTCGIEVGGQVRCWGYSLEFQTDPPAGLVASAICVGYRYGCVVTTDGAVVCWDDNHMGPKGFPPAGLTSASQVACSVFADEGLSMALDDNGGVWRWGNAGTIEGTPGEAVGLFSGIQCAFDAQGETHCAGSGPGPPPAGEVVDVSGPGWDHACAIRPDGTLFCWGDPSDGKTVVPP